MTETDKARGGLVNEAERQKLWIVEWSFRGGNKWSPVDRRPYRAVSEAESYPKRRGFDYRIVEYVEAARASESSPPQPEAIKDYSNVFCGGLGCDTDDCKHFGKECRVLKMTPCLIPAERAAATAPSAPPTRSIDGKFSMKYGMSGGQIVNTVSGEVIPEDEPLFLLRSRDNNAIALLHSYLNICKKRGCNDLHLAGIRQVLDKFQAFAAEHPERMKQPGITKHLKLEEAAPSAPPALCNEQMCPVAGGGFLYCNAAKGHDGPHSFTSPIITACPVCHASRPEIRGKVSLKPLVYCYHLFHEAAPSAPTATDWMRKAVNEIISNQPMDGYRFSDQDQLVAIIAKYAGEHAGAESKKEPTV